MQGTVAVTAVYDQYDRLGEASAALERRSAQVETMVSIRSGTGRPERP